MLVCGIDEFEGHGGSALHDIEDTAGSVETSVAVERDKFQLAAVHDPTERGSAAVYRFLHVFNDRSTWMQYINHFFIVVFENIL